MIATETEFLQFLDAQSIPYQRVEHPPVFTCEQAEQFRPPLEGVSTKNLFLCDERSLHYYLVMTACEKRLDLKRLGKDLGISKPHFASEDGLKEFLGVTPGAVTVLGLVNDVHGRVELLVDEEIWAGEYFLCHPLVNTATLVLRHADLLRFFELTHHSPQVVCIPAR